MKKPPFEAAAAVMRAEILDADRAAQTLPRGHIHTYEELLHGAEVFDVPTEAALWGRAVLAEHRDWQLNSHVAAAFEELAPRADRDSLDLVKNVCNLVSGDEGALASVRQQHLRWAAQASVYLMLLGDRLGAQNLVCRVYEALKRGEHTSHGFYQTWLTFLETLAVAMGDDVDAPPRPRLHARLVAEHDMAMVSEVVLLREAATAALIDGDDPTGFLRASDPSDEGNMELDPYVSDPDRPRRASLRPRPRLATKASTGAPDDPTPAGAPARRPLVSGSLDHLTGVMTPYKKLAKAMLPSVPVGDLAEVRDGLVEETPWAAAEIARMLAPLAGRDRVVLPGHLLVGAQGSGKSEVAVRLLERLGLTVSVCPAGGTSDGASFGGTSRMYHTARLSVPGHLMLSAGSATVGLVIDEGDKIGTSDLNGLLTAALLAVTEPARRHAYRDPGLDAETDLSGLSLIVTANRAEPLRGPLLDRLTVVPWPSPRRQDLPVVARGIVRALRREAGTDAVWLPDLDASEIRALQGWTGGSMRPLRRAIERLVALRSDPKLAN